MWKANCEDDKDGVATAQKYSIEMLLDERKVADVLNLSPRTLQAWRVRGCGPRFRKLGGAVRYCWEDVQAFVNQNEHQSTSEKSYKENSKF